jgi:hypothetical protein
MLEKCPCGSGKEAYIEYDGNGIPFGYMCSECKKAKLARYRSRMFQPYTQNDVDEPIEEDY